MKKYKKWKEWKMKKKREWMNTSWANEKIKKNNMNEREMNEWMIKWINGRMTSAWKDNK